MSSFVTWLQSDRSLLIRVAIGLTIFATLAIIDYRKHRERATRWREYAFLATCVALAIAYGIANDLITSRISPEYFLFFKGAADRVSGEVAANPELHRATLDWQAVRIGTMATWSVGLLAGAAILIANTIGQRPRLHMRRLLRLLPILFACAIAGAAMLGLLGWNDALPWIRDNFDEPSLRPRRLMCTYGIHLGGYLGAGIGLAIVIAMIRVLRRQISIALMENPLHPPAQPPARG